jgi:hypothetical protein
MQGCIAPSLRLGEGGVVKEVSKRQNAIKLLTEIFFRMLWKKFLCRHAKRICRHVKYGW